MLARVAENVYWLARYLERAENTGAPGQMSTRTCCSTCRAGYSSGLATADRHHRQPGDIRLARRPC